MTKGHIASAIVGAIGAAAVYLVTAMPEYAVVFQGIAAISAGLGPVFAMATPKAGA